MIILLSTVYEGTRAESQKASQSSMLNPSPSGGEGQYSLLDWIANCMIVELTVHILAGCQN